MRLRPDRTSVRGRYAHNGDSSSRRRSIAVDLWAAQTPQVFRTEALRGALDGAPEDAAAATDEAMLVEAAGGRVLIHPAPAEN